MKNQVKLKLGVISIKSHSADEIRMFSKSVKAFNNARNAFENVGDRDADIGKESTNAMRIYTNRSRIEALWKVSGKLGDPYFTKDLQSICGRIQAQTNFMNASTAGIVPKINSIYSGSPNRG